MSKLVSMAKIYNKSVTVIIDNSLYSAKIYRNLAWCGDIPYRQINDLYTKHPERLSGIQIEDLLKVAID